MRTAPDSQRKVSSTPAASRPKTLHLTNAYHPSSGGVRAVYRTILNTANALGRPARLIVPGARSGVEEVGAFGRIYYVEAPRAFVVDRRYRLILPTRYLLPFVSGIRQILQHEQPDIVEVCDKLSLLYLAGLLRKGWIGGVGRPTLVATSAERFDDNVRTFIGPQPWATSFARWFMRAVYAPMFDAHLCNSTYTADELRTALPEHRQSAVHIVPPSLPAEAYDTPRGADTRNALLGLVGGDERTRLLVYVGRLSREKNPALLVDMLTDLVARETTNGVTYHLLVAGDGPERRAFEEAQRTSGGRLHLLGNLPGGLAVRRLLACADALVHPNPREPFGLAPLEAMAAGLPVVVPDAGGVLSYADANTARLSEATPRAFADAVREVFAQPARTAQRVAAARIRAAAFHEQQVVPRYFALLDELHARRLATQAAAMRDTIGDSVVREAAASR